MAFDFDESGLSPNETLIARIQNRRGNRVNLPQPLAPGEFGLCVDTTELFIGLDDGSALAAIELFTTGNISGARTQTNDTINERVIEYWSKWIALNVTTELSTGDITSEQAIVEDLASLSSSAYIAANNQTDIADLVQSVAILTALNDATTNSVPPAFANIVHKTWEVESVDATAAQVDITAAGGLITGGTLVVGAEGLGYINGQTILVASGGTGTGGSFNITVVDDGQGMIASLVVNDQGSGYTTSDILTLEAPDRSSMIATATANVTSGAITSITIDTGGLEYDTEPVITITDDFGSGAIVDSVTITARSITAINLASGGANYVSPVVTISDPKTNTFYRFRYDIGVEDVSPGTPFDSTALITTVDNLDVYVDPLYTGGTGFLLDLVNKPTASIVGISGSVASLAYQMAITEINFETTVQAANVAALVNILSTTYSTGVVVTKQNIEILTEFSAISGGGGVVSTNGDSFYTDLTTATLTPQVSFTATGISWPLGDTDVQQIEFSAVLNDFITPANSYATAGTMTIISNEQVNESAVNVTSSEVRGGNILPILSAGPVVSFKTIISGTNVVLQYRHDFADDLIFKLKTNRWLSF